MGDQTGDLAGKRVLIVEDKSTIAMFIEDSLMDLGCVVAAVAARLRDALEKAETAAIDIAILDVNLAGQQTFDVARKLATRHIPFVFSTGYGRAIVPEDLQGTPVLQKPFQLKDLESALKAALVGR